MSHLLARIDNDPVVGTLVTLAFLLAMLLVVAVLREKK